MNFDQFSFDHLPLLAGLPTGPGGGFEVRMRVEQSGAGMIQVQKLQKTFVKDGQRIEAIKGLDFEIAEGGSLAIVGVSGAGKSTLIHIIGTLDHPTSGTVLFGGLDVFNWPEKRLAAFRNRQIGFVFQFHNLLPEFTALENVAMPLLVRRDPVATIRVRAREVLERVGRGARLDHRPAL